MAAAGGRKRANLLLCACRPSRALGTVLALVHSRFAHLSLRLSLSLSLHHIPNPAAGGIVKRAAAARCPPRHRHPHLRQRHRQARQHCACQHDPGAHGLAPAGRCARAELPRRRCRAGRGWRCPARVWAVACGDGGRVNCQGQRGACRRRRPRPRRCAGPRPVPVQRRGGAALVL